MKIVSWNVAGLRAFLKKYDAINLQEFLNYHNPDIICLQETKCNPNQATLPDYIINTYPHRYWGVNPGTTQRKGLSGVCVWSKVEGKHLETPSFDTEGRLCSIEFDDYILVNVYTPNSQAFECERYFFRTGPGGWDDNFGAYIQTINNSKPTIICGDLNVVSLDIDYFNYKKNQNKMPGLFYTENFNFKRLINNGYIDVFRHYHPSDIKYTHWSNFCKSRPRNGWRLDYFLVPSNIIELTTDSEIIDSQLGSDHCPISLTFN